MRITFNIKYGCAFVAFLIIETLIAVFVHDRFLRPYGGDILVVVLVYCFVKTFMRIQTRWVPLYILIFAVSVEFGQYFNLAALLGLSRFTVARIILGSTFDIKDVLCYGVGCLGIFIYEHCTRDRQTA